MKLADWKISNYGGVLHVNSPDLPKETIVSIDLETNGKEFGDPEFEMVCLGVCGNGTDVYVYFGYTPELIEYLKKTQLVMHNGNHADMLWLESVGVSIEQLYYDTKIGYYVFDSARKHWALKPILKEVFGIAYPDYTELTTDKDTIESACEMDSSLMPKDKKGLPKIPKKLDLTKLPQQLVAEYNGSDAFWQFKLWKFLEERMSVAQKAFFKNIELPMTKLLYRTERLGVKIDTKQVAKIHKVFSKKRRASKAQIDELLGEKINLNSPKQLLPALVKQGLTIASTGEDVLVPFKHFPVVNALLDYRGYQKLCSTYTIPLYFNARKDKDSRIYAKFNQNTITGRLSSSNPINLQNQPPETRECFVAKEGHSFINADWSNIELRLPAHFSGEPVFIEELGKKEGDLHARTGDFLFSPEWRTLPEEEYKKKRHIAKTCNFTLTNSGTPSALAAKLECSYEEAEAFYTKWWERYSVLKAWLQHEKHLARVRGGIFSWFGRWVPIPQLKLGCLKPWLCGKRTGGDFTYRCRNCIIRSEAEKTALSIKVQGTASDMCKLAALRLYNEYGYVPEMLVHDEIQYCVPDAQIEEVKERVRYVMENVVTLKIPLFASVGVGKDWKTAKEDQE